MHIKSKVQFINEFNNHTTGWQFNGTNPFSEKNMQNHKLIIALIEFARHLGFDDPDDLVNLQEFFDDLED